MKALARALLRTVLIGGAGVAAGFVFIGLGRVGETPQLMALVLAFGTLVYVFYAEQRPRRAPLRVRLEERAEGLEGRVAELVASLQRAARDIGDLEIELGKRRELVEHLKREKSVYERFASMAQEELEAVAETVRGELKEQDRRSFRSTAALNAAFFVLGVLATVLLTKWLG